MERVEPKGKNYRWIVIVSLNFLVFHAIGIEPVRVRLQETYTKEVGVHEATGHNDGARIESYLAVTGLGKGNPWCAAFVSWCFKQSGIVTMVSARAADWFKSDLVYKRTLQKIFPETKIGMLFGLWSEKQGRICHIGFVDGGDKNNIYTTEGNSNQAGSNNGGEVCRLIRSKKSIYTIADKIKN